MVNDAIMLRRLAFIIRSQHLLRRNMAAANRVNHLWIVRGVRLLRNKTLRGRNIATDPIVDNRSLHHSAAGLSPVVGAGDSTALRIRP
jgi:hypothetical protein